MGMLQTQTSFGFEKFVLIFLESVRAHFIFYFINNYFVAGVECVSAFQKLNFYFIFGVDILLISQYLIILTLPLSVYSC